MNLQVRTSGNGSGTRLLPMYVDETKPTCALALPGKRQSVREVADLVGQSIRSVKYALARATKALDARDPETTSPVEALANLRALDEVVARLRLGIADDHATYVPRSAAERNPT